MACSLAPTMLYLASCLSKPMEPRTEGVTWTEQFRGYGDTETRSVRVEHEWIDHIECSQHSGPGEEEGGCSAAAAAGRWRQHCASADSRGATMLARHRLRAQELQSIASNTFVDFSYLSGSSLLARVGVTYLDRNCR
eukprot:537313-Pleurochrysis_carterae.AAC.2